MKMKIKSSVSCAESRNILRRQPHPRWKGRGRELQIFSVIRPVGREGGWRWDRGVVDDPE